MKHPLLNGDPTRLTFSTAIGGTNGVIGVTACNKIKKLSVGDGIDSIEKLRGGASSFLMKAFLPLIFLLEVLRCGRLFVCLHPSFDKMARTSFRLKRREHFEQGGIGQLEHPARLLLPSQSVYYVSYCPF